MDSFQNYTKLTTVCRSIAENPTDLKLLEKLKDNIYESSKSFIKAAQKPLIASFYPYMKTISSDRASFSTQGKQTLVEALKELLDKLTIENTTIFFNFYSFLLFELYDYTKHQVLPTTEEYKTDLLNCMISLIKSVSLNILEELYGKENVPKFSQIIYVCGELAKKEKSRDIRCTAIQCIMALAKVMDSDDFSDVVLRDKCAEMFMFFLPGLSSTFSEIALEDLKVGHKVPMMSITAFGRIIALVMQDYNPPGQNLDINKFFIQTQHSPAKKTKWKDKKEIDDYLETSTRSVEWYKLNDEKLDIYLKKFAALTHHTHVKIRLALVNMASDIIKNCGITMPQSICSLIEILIILSEDDEFNISSRSDELLNDLSGKLSDDLKMVFESLEEGFYNAVNSLPRKFNSVEDAEKISALNLLIGYIKLFGKHKLHHVLLSPTILHKLVQSLLHVSQLERSSVSLLEEYTLKDLNLEPDFRSPWINFHYFKDDVVKSKIEMLCVALARNNCCAVIYDSLFDTFLYDPDRRKEAVFLINAHILGFDIADPDHQALLKNILDLYTDQSYNDLQLALDSDDYTLEETQNNIILICLLTEGVGKVSVLLKEKFRHFLLKSLYMVLEKAGSGQPLIRAAGLLALNNMTCSCGYSDITDLVNSNFDFFSYHVERKLIKAKDKEDVLNVLSVVLKYSNKSVLLPMSNIVEEVLLQSCDRFKQRYATAYLKTFEMFIGSLRRWFEIEVVMEPVKSKEQKEEQEDFKVSGINYNEDFSDDIMEGKTAEELYREDMENKDEEGVIKETEEEEEEYKKPEPPVHIKLTSSILRRSLHFLPSKSQERKILVLNILENGIEILKEWEDELLPVVHQIWSPLVQRFKEEKDPLTLRLSICLLRTLARLSKDFIRMRVSKEVLPIIKESLTKSATSSYLKDKGSAYRYSQNYKLQLEMLQSLGPILYYLDVDGKIIVDMMDSVYSYLSDKQPQDLQAAAVGFYKEMAVYDVKMTKEKLSMIRGSVSDEYEKNIERIKKII